MDPESSDSTNIFLKRHHPKVAPGDHYDRQPRLAAVWRWDSFQWKTIKAHPAHHSRAEAQPTNHPVRGGGAARGPATHPRARRPTDASQRTRTAPSATLTAPNSYPPRAEAHGGGRRAPSCSYGPALAHQLLIHFNHQPNAPAAKRPQVSNSHPV